MTFLGSVEVLGNNAELRRKFRIERLQAVRAQEATITAERCARYRAVLDQCKSIRIDHAIKEKTIKKLAEHNKLKQT